jgi:hypothetical protein
LNECRSIHFTGPRLLVQLQKIRQSIPSLPKSYLRISFPFQTCTYPHFIFHLKQSKVHSKLQFTIATVSRQKKEKTKWWLFHRLRTNFHATHQKPSHHMSWRDAKRSDPFLRSIFHPISHRKHDIHHFQLDSAHMDARFVEPSRKLNALALHISDTYRTNGPEHFVSSYRV